MIIRLEKDSEAGYHRWHLKRWGTEMKEGLPANHGLPPTLVDSAIFHRADGVVTLTDVQAEALAAGVGRGANILALAPTSSGKTHIGIVGMASWLAHDGIVPRRAVYLTSHRALARQKFNDFVAVFSEALSVEAPRMVLATGDGVVNAAGDVPDDLDDVAIIVATYEKYLGILSGGGMQRDLSHVCFVCDELQILNDPFRGQAVEVLLTVLRQSKFGQFIGLSAVVAPNDAKAIAEWLNAKLVSSPIREVPITYELRLPNATVLVRTDKPDQQTQRPARHRTTMEILRELAKRKEDSAPIAVFCMRRKDVFDLAKGWAREMGVPEGGPEEMPPDFSEITSTAEDLACYAPYRFAYHTADLVEQEREFVEGRLDRNELAVVFSTTTLAMGLNYSFRTVILDRWRRWNFDRKQEEPIQRSEFHNIAGRAGRLGRAEEGRVIFTAEDRWSRVALQYLALSEFDAYVPRLQPDHFSQIILQLLASGLTKNREEVASFLQGTLSAKTALEIDAHQPSVWAEHINVAFARLQEWGFLR
nr:DEAD/DEAH box helicase [Nitrosomonas nitrosa]